ncbi:MAG TPA: hypothetical protein VIU42_00915 [Xanthobacteraceae bacterium]|jgi:hypothetical protein
MITNAEKILAAGLATAAFIATMFLLLVRDAQRSDALAGPADAVVVMTMPRQTLPEPDLWKLKSTDVPLPADTGPPCLPAATEHRADRDC